MEEEKGTTGSINTSLNGKDDKINLSGQIHHLPCCIKFNGPCTVSKYFKPKLKGMEIDGLAVEEGHFRGSFVLAKNNSGKRKACDVSEGNPNNWEMKAKFDKFDILES